MKIKMIVLLLVIAAGSFAQGTKVTYKDIVSFRFPGPYDVLDTLSTVNYVYTGANEILFCNISQDPSPGVVSSEEALEQKFTAFVQNLGPKLGNHKMLSSTSVDHKGRKSRHITVETSAFGKYTMYESYIFAPNDLLIQFNALTKGPGSTVVDQFFQSIEFHDNENEKDIKDKDAKGIVDEKKDNSISGNGKLLSYILGGLLVAGVIFFLLKRRKNSVSK